MNFGINGELKSNLCAAGHRLELGFWIAHIFDNGALVCAVAMLGKVIILCTS